MSQWWLSFIIQSQHCTIIALNMPTSHYVSLFYLNQPVKVNCTQRKVANEMSPGELKCDKRSSFFFRCKAEKLTIISGELYYKKKDGNEVCDLVLI